VGLRKFPARITNYKFQTESKAPFCPSPPAAQKEKFYVITSPTSCQVENGFSWATHLLSKEHNSVLQLTTLTPKLKKLASVHHAQGTH